MIHYFAIDSNDGGRYLRIGIETECDRTGAWEFLKEYSKDVRYHNSKEKRGNRDTGTRRIPIGTIVYCKEAYDKVSSFGRNRKSPYASDPRHSLVAS